MSRCARCSTSLEEPSTCPHDLPICRYCDPTEVCAECAADDDAAPDCRTCGDRTEVWTGRNERETGMPITADCPDCTETRNIA